MTRDAEVIHHHYDVSNRFYELVLGPSMTYTCAVYPQPTTPRWRRRSPRSTTWSPASSTSSRASGCSTSAAAGAAWSGTPPASTASRPSASRCRREQAAWAQEAIDREGLGDLAEVRHLDYRDVPETGFDAVSSIGLTEHIGVRNYPAYFAFLRDRLRPGGPAAQPLHHPAAQPARRRPARSSTGTSSPTAS